MSLFLTRNTAPDKRKECNDIQFNGFGLDVFHILFRRLVHGGVLRGRQPEKVREPRLREQPVLYHIWFQQPALRRVSAGADE